MRKSVWIPVAFALYSAILYTIFIPRSSAGQTEILVTVGVNILIIVALWFLYRKKEEMAARREKDLDEQERRERR